MEIVVKRIAKKKTYTIGHLYILSDKDVKRTWRSGCLLYTSSAAYHISVYTIADGYKASDKAEATLYWICLLYTSTMQLYQLYLSLSLL